MKQKDADVAKLLPLRPLDFSILVALAEEERYGYSLAKRIAEEGGGGIHLPASNLYNVLDRLIEAGLIRVTERVDPEDARRRYFGLTELGRRAAAAESRRVAGLLKSVAGLDLLSGDRAR